ncbi:sugar kinase [Aliihoeflea aestuarii]|uniref:sugar kinase n=1 Tax=Aliihoeflea aestuarii TaxID=453840 RepID=UPI0020943D42|nr:sugar kinase [Aliihoeflea aestuarii]
MTNSPRLFLSIGEPMVELGRAGQHDGDEAPLWRMGYAGDVLNTLWYARACLPAEREENGWQTSLFTRLGVDPFSDRLKSFLNENGIDTTYVQTDSKRSVGLYAIEILDGGERRFSYWRSDSAARLLADDANALHIAAKAADVVYASGITLAILPEEGRKRLIATLAEARADGRLAVFDPNIRPALWESEDALRFWLREGARAASIGLPSFEDEAVLFGDSSVQECARRWLDWGTTEVAVKNAGAAMAITAVNAPIETLEVERVDALDTTGAGDAFNGGYLSARLMGADRRDAAVRGHLLAATVVRHRGALIPMRYVAAEA